MQSRCLMLFESSMRSKSTIRSWKRYIANFLKWSNQTPESFLSMKKKDVENLIVDYAMYQKTRVNSGELSPNTFPDFFNDIFKFLKSNGKKIDKEMITQHYPDRVKCGGDRAITDDEVRQLLSFADVRERALIHVVASTGSRPEAIAELKIKHVQKYQDGFTKLILYADDFKHEYLTFLTPEASHAFQEYLTWRIRKGEKITDESSVFASTWFHTPVPMKVMTMQTTMHRLFEKSGIRRVKTGKRYDLPVYGGFRKRFQTKLDLIADISDSTVQVLMDHTGYLSQHYRKPTEEQIFKEYKKAVNELAISQEWKLKQELEESKKENIVEKDKRIDQLETTLAKQEIMLNVLMKKLENV